MTGRTTATTSRGQSESIGVVLLVGVVAVSVSLFGAFALTSGFAGAAGSAGGPVHVVGDAAPTALELSHSGGRSLPLSDLRVEIANGTTTTAYHELGSGMRDDDGDGAFEAGETWRLRWSPNPGEELTVLLVDEERNRIVYRESFVPRP